MISEGVEWMPQTGQDENTIQFNYFIGDELVNVKYRDGRKNFKLYKGAEKVFYNIDSTVGHDTVMIVEGEMDVCAIHESGYKSVVSVPNGATLNSNNLDYLDNCIDYFEDKEKIIIAVDSDEAGIALQTELIRRFGAELCWVVDFDDCKDANEYLIKYGNIFSTYTGQFITVTGIPSSGKSDFVDQMVVGYNKLYNWKTAFASPENQPTFLHAHKLMRKIWGGMPTINDIKTSKWTDISETINDNFYFIDVEKYNLEEMLLKGAELVKRKGIKCLVLDPYNKIRSDDSLSDVNIYTMEYLSKIEVFAKKYDVLVIIVAHPTKMYRGQNGVLEEPTMYNIKGGGEWYDASYHGILVHRNYEEKTVKAKVLKVKFQNLGENGAEAHFHWDRNSGGFIPKDNPSVENETMPWE